MNWHISATTTIHGHVTLAQEDKAQENGEFNFLIWHSDLAAPPSEHIVLPDEVIKKCQRHSMNQMSSESPLENKSHNASFATMCPLSTKLFIVSACCLFLIGGFPEIIIRRKSLSWKFLTNCSCIKMTTTQQKTSPLQIREIFYADL